MYVNAHGHVYDRLPTIILIEMATGFDYFDSNPESDEQPRNDNTTPAGTLYPCGYSSSKV